MPPHPAEETGYVHPKYALFGANINKKQETSREHFPHCVNPKD